MIALSEAASNGGSCQLRSRSSCPPWNKPQSIKTPARSVSIKYFDPVTVPAAPQNDSVGIRAMLTDHVSESRTVDWSASVLACIFLENRLQALASGDACAPVPETS